MSKDVFDRLAAVNPIAHDEPMSDTVWSASLLRAVIDERREGKSGIAGRLANRFGVASRWSGPLLAFAVFVVVVLVGALTFFALVRPAFEPASPPPVATPPPVVATTAPAVPVPRSADSSTSSAPTTTTSTTTTTLATVPYEGSIAYSALKSNIHYDIHVASAQGGTVRLTADEAGQVRPDWSPDGQFVVYLDDGRNVTDYDVWIIEVATGQKRRVTETAGRRENSPSFAPDGQSIAYTIDGDIVIADLNGTELNRLSVGASRVAWSPDGTQLAFITIGAQDSLSTTTLGGETTLILEGWDLGDALHWGPAGIVMELTEPGAGGESRVSVISPEGSILQQFDPGWIDPSWGPDGRILVVEAESGEIGWLDRDGSYTGPLVIVAESYAETPVWTPFSGASE